MYFAWDLGLTNHILHNVIERVFQHIPRGRWKEEHGSKNSLKQYESIDMDQDWNYLYQLIGMKLPSKIQGKETNWMEP